MQEFYEKMNFMLLPKYGKKFIVSTKTLLFLHQNIIEKYEKHFKKRITTNFATNCPNNRHKWCSCVFRKQGEYSLRSLICTSYHAFFGAMRTCVENQM